MSLLVHEVAQEAKIHTETVKRAERRGLITSKRDHNGWRRYGWDAVQRLKELYGRSEEKDSV